MYYFMININKSSETLQKASYKICPFIFNKTLILIIELEFFFGKIFNFNKILLN